MLQDPSVEDYIVKAIAPLEERIAELEKQLDILLEKVFEKKLDGLQGEVKDYLPENCAYGLQDTNFCFRNGKCKACKK